MPIAREIPSSWTDGGPLGGGTARSMTPMDALMRTPPFQDPDPSTLELLGTREAIQDAIDTVLDGQERWVFNAITVERMSFRRLAKQLGTSKSSVVRTRNRAVRKLRAALEHHPAIRDHLVENPT